MNAVPRSFGDHPISGARALLRRAWASNAPLTFVGAAMATTLAITLIGLVLDPRVITGAPAWLKPMKFAVSIAVYSFTLVWLLGFVHGRPRPVALISWVTAGGLAVEMVLIVGQVVRGTTSHFNVATPVDALIWSSMGTVIVSVWAMTVLLAVLLLRQRMPERPFAWSLRLGVIVAAVGMAVAFLMTSPTPEQLAAGGGPSVAGAHSVGVADGGPALPVTGWSTVGGDLRVAHFFGLHALQILPALGYLLTIVPARRLGPGHRVALVWTAGATYLGLVLLLAWQALRGQSLVAPDALTLAALAALAGGAGAAALAVVAHAGRSAT